MAISNRALRYFRKGIAMRASTSVFILFLLLTQCLFAAKTTLKGYVPGAENLKIRLYSYDDYISNREALIAVADIDSTGHFSMTLSIYEKQVISGFFRIMDFTSREMYIPANKNYELEFEPFDYKDPNRIHIPLLSTILLQYTIKNADAKDLNNLISSFNQEYSAFIMRASGINTGTSTFSVKRPPRNLVDSFVNAVSARYSNESNDFLKNYITYSLANLQLNFQSKSRTSLFDNYIYKKPILYDNVAYMDFFTSYFSDFIYRVSNHIQPYDIIQNVNMKVNLSGLVDSIGKDTMLRNEQLREAVLLLNIRDWYTSKTFCQDSLLKILDVYAARTKFDIQGRIARNLKFMLTHFNSGNPAPAMKFVSLEGAVFNNDSLKGKYSYIMFFTTWSKPCLSELLVMNQLMDSWKDSIQFIAVSMDREPLKLFYFLDENKFSFPVYHFGGDWVMAENLGLLSYPHGMFIDKKGNLINYCMPDPSRGVTDIFKKYAGVKTVYEMPDVGH